MCHSVTVSQLFENAFQPIKKFYNYIYIIITILLGCFINFKKL